MLSPPHHPPSRIWAGLVGAFALALAVGCSDAEQTDSSAPADKEDAGSIIGFEVVSGVDSGGTVDDGEAADVTVEEDVGEDIGSPDPGTFGWPCAENDECDSDFCIPTPSGKVCTKTCTNKCPKNFKCTVVNVGQDPISLCVPRFANLCDPCNSNEDCNASGEIDNVCVNLGTDGSFCGAGCGGASGECPPGYECAAVIDQASGKTVKQCMITASTGECACSQKAVQLGLSTACENKNLKGSCDGVRVCGPKGLSGCQAPVPKDEECNKIDDDCDGKTDNFDITAACKSEPNQWGSCPGTLTACVDGQPQCDALAAKQEVACNQIDDDCDGDTDEGSCDDGNKCTKGVCTETGACKYVPQNGVPCDDGNTCTTADKCSQGMCQGGAPLDCNDGDDCTKDSCDPFTGCVHTGQSGICPDDGNPCTQDVCKGDKCAHPPVAKGVDCLDDGDPCTVDVCDSGVCTHPPATDGASCLDDGNPCTSDVCSKGVCLHPSVTFTVPCADDGNACTADICDGGKCTHQKLGSDKSCLDDGDPCTQDVCLLGKCSHPPVANNTDCLDDGEPCTNDVCISGKCSHPALNEQPCADDGNPCTQDKCWGGKCTHPGASGKACADDGNPCTNDLCQGSKCAHPYNNSTCSDGDPCTTIDKCNLGKCKGYNMLNCNDNDVCTYDKCNKGQGCVHTGQSGQFCDDGNVCTKSDKCVSGKCKGTGGVNCDDGNPCTTDGCNSKGGCTHKANSKTCTSDGNPCTTDICKSKSCKHLANSSGSCCGDGNPCTSGKCSNGQCKQANNNNVCDDGNACTSNDKCVSGKCVGKAFKNCNDGNPCTQDSCNKFGQCTHTGLNGVGCGAKSSACPIGVCQGSSCISKPGVTCQAKYSADLCSSVSVPGKCAGSGKCVANSAPPGYTCPGCNGICIKCLIFQFCLSF